MYGVFVADLPPFLSTKCFIILMTIPAAMANMLVIRNCGFMLLEPGASGKLGLTVGHLNPGLGLASNVLLGRFWKGCRGKGVHADPVKEEPRVAMAVVAAGAFLDIALTVLGGSGMATRHNALRVLVVFPLLAGYVGTIVFFVSSWVEVLRSTKAVAGAERVMAGYLVAIACCVSASLASYVMLVSEEYTESVASFYVMGGLYYYGRVGAAVCHMCVWSGMARRREGGRKSLALRSKKEKKVAPGVVLSKKVFATGERESSFVGNGTNKTETSSSMGNKWIAVTKAGKLTHEISPDALSARDQSEDRERQSGGSKVALSKVLSDIKTKGAEKRRFEESRIEGLEKEKEVLRTMLREIRNPLNAITTASQYVLDCLWGELTEKARSEIVVIEGASLDLKLVVFIGGRSSLRQLAVVLDDTLTLTKEGEDTV